MKDIIIATKNKGKLKEFEQMLHPLGKNVRSLYDYPEIPPIIEDGKTFAENAAKKAEAIAATFQTTVIADDSGLVVDALNGQPGVYSARYTGEHTSDEENNDKVLTQLQGLPAEKRTARFVCVIAVARPGHETTLYEGTCEGIIHDEPVGDNGFGYDPIFFIPELNKTMAELDATEKNKRSHRAQALNQMLAHMSSGDKGMG